MPCMHKKYNPGLSSSIDSPGFLNTTFLHLFYGMVKNNDLLNLNTRVKIEWVV